ncbi:MAG: hypothetical protein AABZ60_00490 [Planctomycetota bacterium]
MNRNRQFSFLELMVAITILTIAIFGLISLILSTMILNRDAQETALANNAIRTKLEEIKGVEWETIYALFHGRGFSVEGLNPISPETNVLFVQFYINEEGVHNGNPLITTDLTPILRQNLGFPNPPVLGQGLDLNGDNIISTGNVSSSYLLLPTQIQARWKGLSGERVINLYSILGK